MVIICWRVISISKCDLYLMHDNRLTLGILIKRRLERCHNIKSCHQEFFTMGKEFEPGYSGNLDPALSSHLVKDHIPSTSPFSVSLHKISHTIAPIL